MVICFFWGVVYLLHHDPLTVFYMRGFPIGGDLFLTCFVLSGV